MMLFKATEKGYIFDKLRKEGEIVNISSEWLDDYKKSKGIDFECSWLEKIEAEEKPKVEPTAEPKPKVKAVSKS
jgi:hypothetical protein